MYVFTTYAYTCVYVYAYKLLLTVLLQFCKDTLNTLDSITEKTTYYTHYLIFLHLK